MPLPVTPKMVLSGKIRILIYLISILMVVFAQNYATNVCPFIDKLSENELLINLFFVFCFHILIREILYGYFSQPFKTLTIPRHMYYLSILSWLLAGSFAGYK